MCGRFTQTRAVEILKVRFACEETPDEIAPRYNLAPTQYAPVIVHDPSAGRVMKMMRWGLIPVWSKDPKIGNRMINARSETLAEKSSFKRPLKKQRCLVPADGFYEWMKVEGQKRKTPLHIRLKGGEPFAFAGLWDRWKDPQTGNVVETFTIVTTASNELMRPFHERMPVILHPEDEDRWLDPENDNIEELLSLLVQYPAEEMEAYEVSTRVNSPGRDDPECIQEVAKV